MNINLPDGRKATVIGQVTDKMSKIRFEDGRESMWPTDKISQPKEGEDTLKMVVIPAIDRLEELRNDRMKLAEAELWISKMYINDKDFLLAHELKNEAEQDFYKKWGLI